MVRIDKTIQVNAPVEHVYRLWDNFENFPRFMKYIEQVRMTGLGTSHWVAKTPIGNLEWDARTTENIPDKRISWNSTEGDINTTGTVMFEPSDAATRVLLRLQYASAPGGRVAEAAAALFNIVEREVESDLQRFKEYAEGQRSSATN